VSFHVGAVSLQALRKSAWCSRFPRWRHKPGRISSNQINGRNNLRTGRPRSTAGGYSTHLTERRSGRALVWLRRMFLLRAAVHLGPQSSTTVPEDVPFDYLSMAQNRLVSDASEGAASTTPICGAPEAKQLPRENPLHPLRAAGAPQMGVGAARPSGYPPRRSLLRLTPPRR